MEFITTVFPNDLVSINVNVIATGTTNVKTVSVIPKYNIPKLKHFLVFVLPILFMIV